MTDVLVLLRECVEREQAKAPPLRDDRTLAWRCPDCGHEEARRD